MVLPDNRHFSQMINAGMSTRGVAPDRPFGCGSRSSRTVNPGWIPRLPIAPASWTCWCARFVRVGVVHVPAVRTELAEVAHLVARLPKQLREHPALKRDPGGGGNGGGASPHSARPLRRGRVQAELGDDSGHRLALELLDGDAAGIGDTDHRVERSHHGRGVHQGVGAADE